jgi:phosphatidylserine/phosphatidylglycerophosphate/cardiolipin synthase-like enzyme
VANTGVRGRVVFAGTPTKGIPGLTVCAFDIDPLNGEDHLGTVQSLADGTFTIAYTPDRYRTWFLDRNPDIEVRIYGEGARLLWETPKADDVQADVFDAGTIEIHESNFRVPDNGLDNPESVAERRSDKYWLVTHTSLNPANGEPVRLTRGNQIDWLVDGALMFPALTDDIANATRSINFLNMMFAVNNLFSKLEFPQGTDHTTVTENDFVKVHRLERILRNQALKNIPVRVLSWDLMDTGDLLSVLLFDRADTADEVKEFFATTPVVTDAFESTQLLHIKAVVVDGSMAYVLGSTMKQGYFSDSEHPIRDARHGERTLMHDVSLKVKGPAVRFVDQTFATIWNAGPTPVEVNPAPQLLPIGGDQAPIGVQVVRTLPGEVFANPVHGPDVEDLPHGETGILESYQRAIMKAEEYIYIEDQYFTSPEIVSALKLRMKEKPALEVIVVLNVKPDIGGYHAKQNAFINELLEDLGPQKDRLGIFTMWSSDDTQPKFEIANIYVHSKLAIVDDVWASVGSANLDGASLNQRQWGLILEGTLDELPPLKKALVTLLSPLLPALAMIPFAPLVLLAGSAITFPTLLPFIVDAIRKETARTTQHANPGRAVQPPRHPELNLVVYNGIAGQPATSAVRELREILWTEQLGGLPPITRPSGGWLGHWRAIATAHGNKIRNAAEGRPHLPTKTKILEWSPEPVPKDYLKALGVKVENINVRSSGQKMPFHITEAQPG